jgi:lipoprotein NlpD
MILSIFFHRSILVILAAGLFLSSCTREEAPSEVYTPKRVNPYYVVKKGDTLESIAARYNMDVSELSSLNNLKSDKILKGQRILVKPKSDEASLSEKPLGTGDETSTVTVEPLDENTQDQKVDEKPDETSSQDNSSKEVNSVTAVDKSIFTWPVKSGKIRKTSNKWVIIEAPFKQDVVAARDGVIRDLGQLIPEYGKMVIVDHEDGTVSIYAYLSDFANKKLDGRSVSLAAGDKIQRGGLLGKVGKPKKSPVSQLHFEIRDKDSNPMNTLKILGNGPENPGIEIIEKK